MTIEQLVAGHPDAERQLRALRAVAAAYDIDDVFLPEDRFARAEELIAELIEADAAAKGEA